jgi:hypothetical protein
MKKERKIELVRANHGGIVGATDGQVLMMANSLPAGTLEKYEKSESKEKVKPNVSS